MTPQNKPFSSKWMFFSMFIFIAVELLLGGLIGNYVVANFSSMNLRFMLQGLLNLVSFFIGGFVIGLVSPGIRIQEPAIGAFASVSIVLMLSIFTPYAFIQFSISKMIIGGAIAFFLALTGAKIAERLVGNKVG